MKESLNPTCQIQLEETIKTRLAPQIAHRWMPGPLYLGWLMAGLLLSAPLTVAGATYKQKDGPPITGTILSVTAKGVVFKTLEGRMTPRIPFEELEEAEIAGDPRVKAFRGGQAPAGGAPVASSPRLQEIVFPEADLDGLPLEVVAKFLGDMAKRYDPQKRGIGFEVSGSLDDTIVVTVVPLQKNVSLEKLLQAVVRGAAAPIAYQMVGEKVVFTAGKAGPTATKCGGALPMLDEFGNPVSPKGAPPAGAMTAPSRTGAAPVATRPVTTRPMKSSEVADYMVKSRQGVVATATQIGSFGEQYYAKRVLLIDCTDLRVVGPGEYIDDYHEFTISARDNHKQINFNQAGNDSGKPRWIYAPTAIANQIAGMKDTAQGYVLAVSVHKRRFPNESDPPACVVTGITPMSQFKVRE